MANVSIHRHLRDTRQRKGSGLRCIACLAITVARNSAVSLDVVCGTQHAQTHQRFRQFLLCQIVSNVVPALSPTARREHSRKNKSYVAGCAQNCSANTQHTQFSKPICNRSAYWVTIERGVRYREQAYVKNKTSFLQTEESFARPHGRPAFCDEQVRLPREAVCRARFAVVADVTVADS
jgi:hypothetical protein